MPYSLLSYHNPEKKSMKKFTQVRGISISQHLPAIFTKNILYFSPTALETAPEKTGSGKFPALRHGKAVTALILRMSGMSLDPDKCHLMLFQQRKQRLP